MKCPFCNEDIKDGAIKCRYCWEFLNKKEQSTSESNGEVKVYWVMSIIIIVNIILGILTLILYWIWIIFLIGAWKYAKWKLEIHDDCVIIKHGIITQKREEIPYYKINSVDTENTLWFVNLVIRTWNDKPTVFKYISHHNEVVEEIKKHIKK